jgi:hypothetical protein
MIATRALTARQATTCETAKTKRCRCRCGGLLHGAGRFATGDEARELADDDAHHAGPTADDKLRRALREAAELVNVDQEPLFDLEGLNL